MRRLFLTKTFLCLIAIVCFNVANAQTTIVSNSATWSYYTGASAPSNDAEGDNWKALNYTETGWGSGGAGSSVRTRGESPWLIASDSDNPSSTGWR